MGYRYGFNGQEQDNELSGDGNINTAEYWEYNCRLGRRWNIDPINFIGYSPFSCFLNNPIFFLDDDGDIPWPSCVNSSNIRSHQGPRIHPIRKVKSNHDGMDIAVKENTPVHSLAQGVVLYIKWNPTGYGNYIVIKHKNGYFTLYGHLNKVTVSLKDKIDNGQTIGLSGNTGGSTGPHLHLEIIHSKTLAGIYSKANKMDPESIPDLELLANDNTKDITNSDKLYGTLVLEKITLVAKKPANGNGSLKLRPLQKMDIDKNEMEKIEPIKLTPIKR